MRRIVLLLAAVLLLAGCQTERRVVRTTGGLQDVPGAEGGVVTEKPLVEKSSKKRAAGDPSNPAGYEQGSPDEMLRVKEDNGKVRLVSRNPRELMFHLRKTLQDGERELIREQVLSERTIQAYRAKGLNPDEAVDFLLKRRDDVYRLLQQLPMGERTPGIFAQGIGPSEFRLEAPPGVTDPPLKFRKFDYVFEHGGCRLLLIS